MCCRSAAEIKDVQFPDGIPVDLKAKLIVCLIHKGICAPLEVADDFTSLPYFRWGGAA